MSLDVSLEIDQPVEIFSYNITHNLNKMADKAGIYSELWRPEELNITVAQDLIAPLSIGLSKLLKDPEYYKTFNPENNWGSYDGLVKFVKEYLTACVENPKARIKVSR